MSKAVWARKGHEIMQASGVWSITAVPQRNSEVPSDDRRENELVGQVHTSSSLVLLRTQVSIRSAYLSNLLPSP
jgi:hypothetical protein